MKGKQTNNLNRIAEIYQSFILACGCSTLGKYSDTTFNILERCLLQCPESESRLERVGWAERTLTNITRHCAWF